MERHYAGEARVIPIILRPVLWSNTPFSHLQALPQDAKAVTTWANRNEAFLEISESIARIVRDVNDDTESERPAREADDLRELISLTEEILRSINDSLVENQRALLPFMQDPDNRDIAHVDIVLLYENQRDRGAFGMWPSYLQTYVESEEPAATRESAEEVLGAARVVHTLFYRRGPEVREVVKQTVRDALGAQRTEIGTEELQSMIDTYLDTLRNSVERIGAALGRLRRARQV